MVAECGQSRHGWPTPSEDGRALLRSRERPIVLLPKRPDADDALAAWRPADLARRDAALYADATPAVPRSGGPPGRYAWLAEAQALVLVMTSANPGGEPLVIGNDEALRRLSGIADA